MNRTTKIPPVIGDQKNSAPLCFLGGLAAAAALLQIGIGLNLPWPQCGFRQWTGLPCPFCGSTRALLAWSHGDVGLAFRFNPLASLACAGLGLWLLLWLADRWWQTQCQSWVQRLANQIKLSWMLLGLVLGNWVYLCLTLPR